MSQNLSRKPGAGKGSRYKTEPRLVGHAHNAHFNDDGVSTGPISEQEIERLKEAFETVTFTKIEEPKSSPAEAGDKK